MKNVVITGISGGLGRCLAKEYLSQGDYVFGFDIEERGILSYLEEEKENLSFELLDVGKDESVEKGISSIAQKISRLDILVNCAGVLTENSGKVLEEFDINGSCDVFNINALGPLRMVKAVLPLLRKSEEAVILNISSEAGSLQTHAGYTYRYDYCMSKAALNMQSIILQRYLEKDNIRVLTVHPGWMRTSMGGEEAPLLPDEVAVNIRKLVNHHQYDYHNMVFMDYNDEVRPW